MLDVGQSVHQRYAQFRDDPFCFLPGVRRSGFTYHHRWEREVPLLLFIQIDTFWAAMYQLSIAFFLAR